MSDETALPECELTAKEADAWSLTDAALNWACPGFQYIWIKMLRHHRGAMAPMITRAAEYVPIAATDGQNVIINADTFFKFPLRQRVFIAAHEVLHNVFDDVDLLHRCVTLGRVPMHDGTSLPFCNDTMQMAMDLRINALLLASRIGERPPVGYYDQDLDGTEDVLDLYRQHYVPRPEGAAGDAAGDAAANPGGFDSVLALGSSVGQAPQQTPRDQAAWDIAISAAHRLESAYRGRGKLPAALQHLFKMVLEPEVAWEDHIETLVKRMTNGDGYDWRQPNPWYIGRDIYQPRKTGYGAGWLVMWADTSGSRSDSEIANNIGHIAGIIEAVNPRRLTVVWCDAAIHRIDELDDASELAVLQPCGGGGGTSFSPVLEWIDGQDETPDLFIGFTDGEVTFPAAQPRFPVIWASSTDTTYPWGEVVRVHKH